MTSATIQHRAVRLATPFLFIPLAMAGDTDDGSRSSRLEMGPAVVGGNARIDLRTASANQPFVLFVAVKTTLSDPDGVGPIPFLRLLGPSSVIATLATDFTGRFALNAQIPNTPALAGATVLAQALTVAPDFGLEATNVAATTFTPGAAGFALFDRSASVPAVAAQNSTGPGAAQDLDGDGDPDLALITGALGTLHLFRNDGAFAFVDVSASALPIAAQIEGGTVELFDANGDRRIDILLIGGPGDPNDAPLPDLLLLNQGGFQFTIGSLPSVPGRARDVAVVDLDRDGDLDLVLANGMDGVHANEQVLPNTLLVNQGGIQGGAEGGFAIDLAFEAGAWNSPDHNTSVIAGDIDNDGDADLFFGRIDSQGVDGTPGQPNVLLRNDGGLVFTDVSATQLTPLFSDNTQGARFADFDGDGNLDLIVANTTVSIQSAASGDYYRNLGNGQFVEDNAAFPQIDESEIALRNGVHVVDIDLDGDLDIIEYLHEFIDFDGSSGSPSGTGGDDLLFVNQGGAQGGVEGVFLLSGGFSVTGIFVTADHVIADFDVDGDDDIYVCNNGGFFQPLPVDDRLLENKRIP